MSEQTSIRENLTDDERQRASIFDTLTDDERARAEAFVREDRAAQARGQASKALVDECITSRNEHAARQPQPLDGQRLR